MDDVRRKIVGVGRGTLEITGAVVLAKDLWDIIGPIFSLVLEEQQLELGRPDLKDKLGDVRRKIVDVGRGTLEIGGEVVLAKEIWDIFGPLLLLASEEQQLERDRSDLTNKLGDIRRKIVDVGHDTLEIEREVALAKELWEVFGPPLLLASELRYFGILLDPHIVDSREKLRAYKQLTYKLSMQPAMNTRVKSRRKST
ncbi:MAG: hypothetical protein RLO04_02540 [Limnobacter sp.]|uniref:hypothetical protein n=1 Tax=Limnobacter sp. TaxID=2003368 RepID=UPI0032EFA0E3